MGFAFLISLTLAAGASAGGTIDEDAVVARSLVSAGSIDRVRHVMMRARRGESVTLGFLGGSVTDGGSASAEDKTFASLVTDWWRDSFPASDIDLVNAGVPSTGSVFGALRADRDLFAHDVDCVVVEFAINDGPGQFTVGALEGLVRQLLAHPRHVAVILLMVVRSDGSNAEDWHRQVGFHYDLPMISLREAVWPELEAGTLQWSDLAVDGSHPNDYGHYLLSRMIEGFLEDVRADLPAGFRFPVWRSMPRPLFSDIYQRTELKLAAELEPAVNDGWSHDAAKQAWTADVPGSAVEFEFHGRTVATLHHVLNAAMGRASVTIDDDPIAVLEGWFDEPWLQFWQVRAGPRLNDTGPHRIRFEILEDKSPRSAGHEFRLMGLGIAGKPHIECGDPFDDDAVKVSDALLILQAAVGRDVSCPAWMCDVTGDGKVVSSDSLVAVRTAVGVPDLLHCGNPHGLRIRLTSTAPLSELRLRVDYSSSESELAGEGSEVACATLAHAATIKAADEDKELDVRVFPEDIITGPQWLLDCPFEAADVTHVSDLAVTILEARDPGGDTVRETTAEAIPW